MAAITFSPVASRSCIGCLDSFDDTTEIPGRIVASQDAMLAMDAAGSLGKGRRVGVGVFF
jgi:hypothetical protein